MVEKIFILLVIYQFKHFLADFPLQNGYMLQKGKDGWDFLRPLASHCAVHAGFTFAITLAFTQSLTFALLLALLDFSIHFTMDRIKASSRYLGRYKALAASEFAGANNVKRRHNTFFWWSLGFDQMVHHLTHYLIIALIVFH